MAHKFQKGDPVFHKGEGYETIRGLYNVTEVGKDGNVYRVTDSQGEYTDADEDELEHALYAVFIRIDHGWPIIIPVYDKPLYKSYWNSNLYRFVRESTIKNCVEEQINILKKLESAEQATD